MIADRARPHSYIPGIDGIRAIAVLSVIIFHIDPSWLPGGFSGVDVFYVVSGFVVAASVVGAPTARFSNFFSWFYRRRLLRILPAAIACSTTLIIFSVLFIPVSPQTKWIEYTGISSLLGLSNFVLAYKAGDYFSAASSFNPFTHTWSLAIEEQYYLLFPFFAYPLFVQQSKRRVALFVFSAVCVLSLILAAILAHRSPVVSFYMLTSRFWELGIGLLLFYFLGNPSVELAFTRYRIPILATALAALLALMALSAESAFPFPGGVPVGIATAAALGSLATRRQIVSMADRVLESGPMRFIGKISYSLYLWHWGVIVAMRWTIGLNSVSLKATAAVLTLLLALASYRFIESPFRSGGRASRLPQRAVFAGALLIVGGVALAALGLTVNKNVVGLVASRDKNVWSPYEHPAEAASNSAYGSKCGVSFTKTSFRDGDRLQYSALNCENAPSRLFVFGDSHAAAYQRLFWGYTASTGQQVLVYTRGGCKLLWRFDGVSPPGCTEFRNGAMAEIRKEIRSGDVLFLPGLYLKRYRGTWDDNEALASGDQGPAVEYSKAVSDSVHEL